MSPPLRPFIVGACLLVASIACGAWSSAPERIDQLAWLETLRAARPALMTQHQGSVQDPAWQALVMTPSLRPLLIEEDEITPRAILAQAYTAELQEADRRWGEEILEMTRTVAPTADLRPYSYGNGVYAGFRMGPEASSRDAEGFGYKVFFGFRDFLDALSPGRYHSLSRELAEHGFVGASKVDLRPGATRFRYNQLVVYAGSPALAACAEKLVLDHYGPAVTHVSRGVDPPPPPGEKPEDWHHFLLGGSFDALPSSVKDYITYRTAPPACP